MSFGRVDDLGQFVSDFDPGPEHDRKGLGMELVILWFLVHYFVDVYGQLTLDFKFYLLYLFSTSASVIIMVLLLFPHSVLTMFSFFTMFF